MATPDSIKVTVARRVAELGSERVVDEVVTNLVESEVTRRAAALAAAVELSAKAKRELNKAKPDQLAIAEDGTETGTYSRDAFEAKKKLEDQIAKIDAAVKAATENGDWGKLYEVTTQLSGKKKDDSPGNK